MKRDILDYFVIRNSGLFDSKYYLETYADVRRADIDPIWHYVKYGWRENRNPSREFDGVRYLENNPDVQSAKINPLVHFIRYGRYEGRLPIPYDLLKTAHFQDPKSSRHEDFNQTNVQGEGNVTTVSTKALNYQTWVDGSTIDAVSKLI